MDLADLKWTDVAALPRATPFVIPIAALEQHGRHMPVFTDSLLLGEVMRRTKEHFTKEIVFTPLMWLGNSEHHLDFPGTLTASPRVYLDLLQDMVENLLFHGFQRIVFVNGHGGNIVPAQQALFETRQQHRDRDDLLLLSTTYWTLGSKPQELHPELKQPHMGHAGEWETSMILRIAPHLVGDISKVTDVEFGNPFEPAHRAWITKDRTEPGHIGYPNQATAEKGEKLLATFTNDVVTFLKRVIAWDGKSWDG
jgi:creatinine amidohydrolase